MTPRHTHTRTVHAIDPANPYLQCDTHHDWVDHFTHTADGEGPIHCEPCGHQTGATSACPSWNPVDGCACAEQLGHIPHGQPPPHITGIR
jgi:hypothetical protein